MRKRELTRSSAARQPTARPGIREGLAYAARTQPIRAVVLMTLVVSTVGFNFHVLVPVLAADTLHAAPEGFGLLSASFGAGALVGALLTASLGRASWKVLLLGTAGFGVSLLLLAPQTSVQRAAALLFVIGVCFTLWTSNSQTILQLTAPGSAARPRAEHLPVRLRRVRPAGRPARRLAGGRRRHAARLLRRGRRRARGERPRVRRAALGACPCARRSARVERAVLRPLYRAGTRP